MPYIGSWNIDDYLTFECNTHDPDTGAAADADSAPAYRIYEDETVGALLTGTLAKLDDDNTTGFYTERVQLTAANGFEVGKSYRIYISATVSTITATKTDTFQIGAKVDAVLVGGATPEDSGDIAAEVLTEMNATPPATNLKKINDIALTGDGSSGTPWGPAA